MEKKKKKNNPKEKKSFINKASRRITKVKEAMFEDLDKPEKATFSVIEVVVIILISIIFGIAIGYMITFSKDPMHGASGGSGLREIVSTYREITDSYYGEVNEDELSNAAIKGMIDSLEDPYSSYMNEETTESFNETVDGSFVGIGVTIQFEEEYNRIIEVFDDSPADKGGIQIDDRIVKVDDNDVKGFDGEQLSSLIRGKKGSKVVVTVLRDDKEIPITMTRDTIELPSVYESLIEENNKKVGYLQVTSFSTNTYKQFEKKLKQLEKDNIGSLVIDVRDNHGGQLQQTKEILSLFFPKGTILYQIESKNSKVEVKSDTKESRSYPVAILINSNSASASEILASCFQERYKKAIIVGSTSYGKGTVQKSQTLSSGTSIKFTTQKWLTSKGNWLEKTGVIPDYVVNQSEEYYQNACMEYDAQLQEAITQLKES